MTKELYHFGVLGMKWGHRKAQSSSDSSSGGSSYKPKMFTERPLLRLGKKKGETNEEYDRDYQQRLKRIDEWGVAQKKVDALHKKAKENPGDADAQIAAYRAQAKVDRQYDPYRPGKKKGQSDEDYDRAFDAKVEKSLRVIADKNKRRAEKKAKKEERNLARDENIAANVRKDAQREVESYLKTASAMAAKKRRPFDEAKERARMESLMSVDLNYSIADVKRERITRGVATAVTALGIIGYSYLLSKS